MIKGWIRKMNRLASLLAISAFITACGGGGGGRRGGCGDDDIGRGDGGGRGRRHRVDPEAGLQGEEGDADGGTPGDAAGVGDGGHQEEELAIACLLYTSPSPRD